MAYQNYSYPNFGNYSPVQPFCGQPNIYPPQTANIPPVQPSAQQNVQGLSPASRPVTNREEANAVSADFSGNLMVFPDITHNRIYVKRWNLQTGAAEFFEFVPVSEAKTPEPPPIVYASMDDLKELSSTIDDLKAEIEKMKKAGKGKKNETDDE